MLPKLVPGELRFPNGKGRNGDQFTLCGSFAWSKSGFRASTASKYHLGEENKHLKM